MKNLKYGATIVENTLCNSEKSVSASTSIIWKNVYCVSYVWTQNWFCVKQASFNKDCWTKANTILTEIKRGFYSDPPDESMYTYKLNDSQDIMKDKYGVPILNCKRDTNALEAQHSHINKTFVKQIVEWEFADAILAERRHWCNIDACKKRIIAYLLVHTYVRTYVPIANSYYISHLSRLRLKI